MMNVKYKKVSTIVFVLTLLVLPTVVYGLGLIPCDNASCGFSDLITLANNIVHFLMYDVAVPLVALGFMYTGARLVIFQNKEGEWTEAKGRFGDIAMGFGMMLGAYVLIKTILYAFLNQAGGYTLFLLQ